MFVIRFTGEIASHWGLIPNPHSHLLDVINDFERSSKDVLALGEEDADHLVSLGDCQDFQDLVEMPMHFETSALPNPDSTPGLTAAEIIRMPVIIDMPMKPVEAPSPCPTEIMDDVDMEKITERYCIFPVSFL